MLYKKNYLTQVILRLDFASVPALLAEHPPGFFDRIRERFPEQQRTQHLQFSINLSPGAPSAATPSPGAWVWRYGNDDQFKKVIALSHNLLTLEYGADQYTSSKEFIDTFLFAYKIFSDLYEVDVINRVGWRYINDIRLETGNALDWHGLINSKLVTGVVSGVPAEMRMTRSMHQLAAVDGDVHLILNYGIQNPEFPNPVAIRSFIIDQDFSISGDVRADSLHNRLLGLNKRAEDLFESVVEDDLRQRMEVIV